MIIKSAILLVCISYAFTQDTSVKYPPEPFPTTTSSDAPTTSSEPTTTPSTPKTTTTETTTTTPKPTTTTPKPTTTTPKPTTPTSKPTTTTPKSTTKPTSTTTKATTTIAPTPAPSGEPAINNFFANNTKPNTYCLIAKMALQLEILGTKTTNSTKINVPQNVSFDGNCSSLNIHWQSSLQNYSIVFNFGKTNNSKVEVSNVTATMSGKNVTTLYHNKSEFIVSEKQSYACAKDEPLTLNNTNNSAIIAKLHITHLKYQAFVNKTRDEFDSAWNCEHANTSDVVPIVVGCVLALLVVLMLVAYLVGRRRCQARGYLSM